MLFVVVGCCLFVIVGCRLFVAVVIVAVVLVTLDQRSIVHLTG